ncbi:hypothetical protein WK65_14705 [Burkholderia ubonensis]|nr:hypothetical protein WK65_14705 [Burkholderia ubonensis]
MLTAPGPKPVREAEKIFLVDRVQHFDHRTLDDLVLQRSNPQWALFPIRLGYVLPTDRQCPVRSTLYLRMQALKVFLQICFEVPPCHAVHSRSRIALERMERLSQPVGCNMVQ